MTLGGGGAPVTRFVVELVVPGEPTARVELTGTAVVGRSSEADVVVADHEVSRRHVRLIGTGGVVTAEDLGSTNGTRYGAVPLVAGQVLGAGDELSVGRSRVRLVAVLPPDPAPLPPPAAAAPPPAPPPASRSPRLVVTPGVERVVPPEVLADELDGAVAALADLGLDGLLPAGLEVRAVPTATSAGVAIDPERGMVTWWIAPDLPPDPLLAALAVVVAIARPAGDVLDVVALGLALDHLGVPDPAPGLAGLAGLDLPATVPDARGPLRTAMARSFVGYLLARCGAAAVQAFLVSEPPPRFAERSLAHLGAELPALDGEWRDLLAAIPPAAPLRGPLLPPVVRPAPDAGPGGALTDLAARLVAAAGEADSAVIGSIAAAGREAHLVAGATADEGDWAGLVVGGRAQLVATGGPFAGTVVADVRAGDAFGVAALAGAPRAVQLRAVSDLELVVVEGPGVRAAGLDLAGGSTVATPARGPSPAIVDVLLVGG